MIKTTKRQDQMHLPSRSNSLFLIPKAGNRVLIRSDPTTKQLYPIRSEMILLDPKSEKIRSDRIRIGFGSDLHISSIQFLGSVLKPIFHLANLFARIDKKVGTVPTCSRRIFSPASFNQSRCRIANWKIGSTFLNFLN